jgi:hypothetical protein
VEHFSRPQGDAQGDGQGKIIKILGHSQGVAFFSMQFFNYLHTNFANYL